MGDDGGGGFSDSGGGFSDSGGGFSNSGGGFSDSAGGGFSGGGYSDSCTAVGGFSDSDNRGFSDSCGRDDGDRGFSGSHGRDDGDRGFSGSHGRDDERDGGISNSHGRDEDNNREGFYNNYGDDNRDDVDGNSGFNSRTTENMILAGFGGLDGKPNMNGNADLSPMLLNDNDNYDNIHDHPEENLCADCCYGTILCCCTIL